MFLFLFYFQSLLQRHTNVIDEVKGFADDVNRLREQSKLMESSEAAAKVRNVFRQHHKLL